LKFETKAIRLSYSPDSQTNAVIPAIHLGTTFRFGGINENTGFDYSRSNNPTRSALERTLAGLEGADFGLAFASGMAATDAVLSILLPGEEVVAARNLYGGTPRLFESYYRPRGIKFNYIDGPDPEAYRKAITPQTRMVWIETPTNPQLQLLDIAALAQVSKAAGVPLIVDNTFASPYVQQPLALGADVVLHSTTKYLAGHHDVIGGGIVTSDAALHEKFKFFQNTAGAIPSPFDCYLTMRGIKTLALRMRQHCANSLAIAKFLQTHPLVENVLYPGLPEHPQHALAKRQMNGFGGMLSFDIKADLPGIDRFQKALRVFHFAESLGGAESLLCHPTTMSHAVLTEQERLAASITPRMIRVSVGIEHEDDLIEDLRGALAAV